MDLDLEDLTNTANWLVGTSQNLPSNPEKHRSGGCLFYGADNLSANRIIQVGTVGDAERLIKYHKFAQEKAHRLFAEWLRDSSHVSSWQTRDVAMKRYGGAVLFNKYSPGSSSCDIISFSGLDEHVDEAVSLILGYHLHLAEDMDAVKVISISENPVFPEMLEAYRAR